MAGGTVAGLAGEARPSDWDWVLRQEPRWPVLITADMATDIRTTITDMPIPRTATDMAATGFADGDLTGRIE